MMARLSPSVPSAAIRNTPSVTGLMVGTLAQREQVRIDPYDHCQLFESPLTYARVVEWSGVLVEESLWIPVTDGARTLLEAVSSDCYDPPILTAPPPPKEAVATALTNIWIRPEPNKAATGRVFRGQLVKVATEGCQQQRGYSYMRLLAIDLKSAEGWIAVRSGNIGYVKPMVGCG